MKKVTRRYAPPQLNKRTHHLVRVLALRLYAENFLVSEACRVAGVHRSNYSSWIHKGSMPDLKTLEALGEVVGLRLVFKPIYEKETRNAVPNNRKSSRERRYNNTV